MPRKPKNPENGETEETWYSKHREISLERAHAWYRENKEKAKENHRKWLEANREQNNATRRKHREEHRELYRQRYEAKKAELNEKRRAYNAANRERLNEYKRAWRAAKKNGTPLPPRKKPEAMSVEEARFEMELEKCPICNAAAGVRASAKGYRGGCVTRTCKAWVDRPGNTVHETRTMAEAAWNAFVKAYADAMEDNGAQEAAEIAQDAPERAGGPVPADWAADAAGSEMEAFGGDSDGLGAEDYIASALPPDWDVGGDEPEEPEAPEEPVADLKAAREEETGSATDGEPEEPEEEPPQEEEAPPEPDEEPQSVEEEPEETPAEEEPPKKEKAMSRKKKAPPPEEAPQEEEPAAEEKEPEEERYARFELVLDGIRYVCEPGEEGCDGCAFSHSFGARQICVIQNEEDAAAARDLCGALQGQWHEVEEE